MGYSEVGFLLDWQLFGKGTLGWGIIGSQTYCQKCLIEFDAYLIQFLYGRRNMKEGGEGLEMEGASGEEEVEIGRGVSQ